MQAPAPKLRPALIPLIICATSLIGCSSSPSRDAAIASGLQIAVRDPETRIILINDDLKELRVHGVDHAKLKIDGIQRLVTADGRRVPGISIPQPALRVTLDTDGDTIVEMPGSRLPNHCGKILVVPRAALDRAMKGREGYDIVDFLLRYSIHQNALVVSGSIALPPPNISSSTDP